MTDTDYASAFADLGSATLGESGGRPMAPRIRPVWAGARVSGPAFPVVCSAADNLAVHVAVLEAHGFPVFSSMIALRGATKEEPGRIGAETLVGDVEVARGDWIVGDTDGV